MELKMKDKLLIDKSVVFHPDTCRLVPVGGKGTENTLNIPSCRCLHLLLQRQGELITQHELIKEVWGKKGQYATANTFYQSISLLRRALKTAGLHGRVIQTIPKEGIRFCRTVTLSKVHTPELTNTKGKDSETISAPENRRGVRWVNFWRYISTHIIRFIPTAVVISIVFLLIFFLTKKRAIQSVILITPPIAIRVEGLVSVSCLPNQWKCMERKMSLYLL